MKLAALAGMIKKKWVWLLVLVLLTALTVFFWPKQNTPEYRTTKIERGNLIAIVSASGTVNPVGSVQVGSQVSGQLKEVLVDFNSEVKQGQLIARIDPETFRYRVQQAQADVESAQAQALTQQANIAAAQAAVQREQVNLDEAKRNLARKETLLTKNFISSVERDTAQATVNTQQEQLKSAQAQLAVAKAQAQSSQATVQQRRAQLAQAKIDLDRTEIRAPVNGVVTKKSVEPGQTVAASLQAPELFVIARDLRDMQVEAAIDEADVGRIQIGQRATFSVDAFPGRRFQGEVKQIRKSPQNIQNVITYTVIIGARNDELILLPGMTANVRITSEQREGILKVANAALRFRPPNWNNETNKTSQTGKQVRTEGEAGRTAREERSARGEQRANSTIARGERPTEIKPGYVRGRLTIQSGKELKSIPVLVGITDGNMTEVLDLPVELTRNQTAAPTLTEGMEVVIGSNTPLTSAPRPQVPRAPF